MGRAARLQSSLEALREAREVAEGAAGLRAQLEEAREWRRRAQAEQPSHNRLIHLRNRLRALRQLEPRLAELEARGGALPTSLPQRLRDDVDGESKRTKEQLEELLAQLAEMEAEMKAGSGRARARGRHEEEFRALQAQVADLEAQILAEHADFTMREETENKIQHLKGLQSRFEELQSTYDAVVRERREKYDSGSVPDLNLGSSVENLVTKVGDCKTILQQKIEKLEKGKMGIGDSYFSFAHQKVVFSVDSLTSKGNSNNEIGRRRAAGAAGGGARRGGRAAGGGGAAARAGGGGAARRPARAAGAAGASAGDAAALRRFSTAA